MRVKEPMKKTLRPKTGKSVNPRVDPYLEGLMSKLLDRLVGLERKMDAVLVQTAGGGGQPRPPQVPHIQPPPRRDRVLYEAICADCHKVCEVPFQPSEGRAVYCKECFAQRKSGGKPFTPPQKPAFKPAGPHAAAPLANQPPKKEKKSKTAKKSKKKK